MDPAEKLATLYLRRDPKTAAKLLETLPREESAKVLSRTPAEVAAGVLTSMLPSYAAACSGSLSAEQAASALRHCSNQQAAAMLRSMPEGERNAILERMDVVRTAALRLLLNYPESTVGAWIQTDALALSDDLTVGEARTRLKEADGKVFNRLFVLDRDRRVRYAVDVLSVMTRSRKQRIVDIADEDPVAIAARVSLEQAAALDEWAKYHEMPVVNRDGEFIGVLSYATVRPAADGLHEERAASGNTIENLNDLTAIFVAGGNAIWNSWLQLVSGNGPTRRRNG